MSEEQIIHDNISCELIITTKCNFSCTYCVAHDLDAMTMDLDSGKKSIDMFVALGKGAKNIEFIFTGGEPLLNFFNLKSLVIYAEEKSKEFNMNPFFVIKTNGSLFESEIVDFCKKYGIKVVISIDGSSKYHDKNRLTCDGRLTHETVVCNLRKLQDNRIELSASLTVHPDNVEHIGDNVKYLHGLGLKEIDVGPVYGTANWSQAQIEHFKKALSVCAQYIRKVNETDSLEISPLNKNSEHVDDILKDCWGCKAGLNNLAFMPNGNIVGCSSLGMLSNKFPELIVGNIDSGINENSLQYLFDNSQASDVLRNSCIICETKNNCAGGCMAINLSTTQTPLIPPQFYCEIISSISAAWENAWR